MKSYLITDPKYYTNHPTKFEQKLQNVIDDNHIDLICFRDKISSNQEELIDIFMHTCKKNNIFKTFINTNIDLAHKYKSHGVHLTSEQFDKIKIAKELSLQVIISTHNEQEIQNAIDLGADYITYSPIFFTPNKGDAKGLENLKYIIKEYPQIPIIALGGIIDLEHLNKIKTINPFGFASIRYFFNN
jgi:thiamine-phosphate pyrophosphorylase